MTSFDVIAAEAFAAALKPGEMTEPAALLARLQTDNSPIATLSGVDGTSPIFEAIDRDFGFVNNIRNGWYQIGDDDRAKWAALLRWVLAELPDWTLSDDPKLAKLGALLTTARFCGAKEGIWHSLPKESEPNASFLQTVARLISGRRMQFAPGGLGRRPISESEFVESFQQADERGDWIEIASRWPQMEPGAWQGYLIKEQVRCLAHYDFNALIKAMDALPQVPVVMEIADVFSDEQRLRAALASSAERTRFCCAFRTLSHRHTTKQLSPESESVLFGLLVKVASAPAEWRAWMTVFNTYPVRYPALAQPLGRALAALPLPAVQTYIDAIHLRALPAKTADSCRPIVSSCFREFAQHADPDHRKSVWRHAFERWCAWNFDEANRETKLLEIHFSQIDFPVASYASECLSLAERESAATSIIKRLSKVELTWHEDETDCTSAWNRLLSKLQPYAHAMAMVESGEDALFGTRTYWPFDASKWLYHRIMFRVNLAAPTEQAPDG